MSRDIKLCDMIAVFIWAMENGNWVRSAMLLDTSVRQGFHEVDRIREFEAGVADDSYFAFGVFSRRLIG